MKPSRVLCLIMFLAMLCSVAACNSAPAASPSPEKTTAPSAEVPTAAPTPIPEPTATPIPEAKMVMFIPWKNTSTDTDLAIVKQAIEDYVRPTINVTLDFIVVPTDGSLEVLNTYLAGGEQLDAASMNLGDANTYLTKGGLILQLDDLLQKYGQDLLSTIPEKVWPICKDNDKKIVYMPDYYQWVWQGAVIRTDWLAECGLQMPTTLPELEAVMQAFKDKYPNKLPATGLPWFLEPYLTGVVNNGRCTSSDNWVLNDKGEVVPPMTLAEYKPFLELYQKWIKAGWFDPEFLSQNDDTEMQLWTSEKVGIVFCDPHRALGAYTNAYDVLIQNNPNAKADFIPLLKDAQGITKYSFGPVVGVGRVVWVSQKSQIPDRVVKYFNTMVADPNFYFLAKLGVKDKHWIEKEGQWTLPEGVKADARPYGDIFAPLAWEFFDQKMPAWSDKPIDSLPRTIHKRLNDSFLTAAPLLTGLEGFTPNDTAVSQYKPIDLWTEIMNIATGVTPMEQFDAIVQKWYSTGGTEIVAEYTKQYNEWKAK